MKIEKKNSLALDAPDGELVDYKMIVQGNLESMLDKIRGLPDDSTRKFVSDILSRFLLQTGSLPYDYFKKSRKERESNGLNIHPKIDYHIQANEIVSHDNSPKDGVAG